MVLISEEYSGNHLQCSDLRGQDVTLVIASASVEKLGDDKKLCLFFRGTDKDLPLNKTNANTIAQMYGDESDHWTGQPITMFPTQADYQGKSRPAIRIRLATPQQLGVAPMGGVSPQAAQGLAQETAVQQVQDAFPGAQEVSVGEQMGPQESDAGLNSDIPF